MSTALITGASSGIGLELARLFAKDKHNVVLVARTREKLQQLANELQQQYSVQVWIIAADLSETTSVESIFKTLQQENIEIDFLVNNAGFGDFGFFKDSKWKKQEAMINVNITTLTYLTWLFLPSMITKGFGRIMNVASTAAFQPGPTMSVYYATKAYVLHFSEAIDNELEGTGVTVTALCPGPTESGFQAAAGLQERKMVKWKKLLTSKQVADYGYKAMKKGKTVAIHGLGNYFLAQASRFVPRKWVVKIARRIQEAK